MHSDIGLRNIAQHSKLTNLMYITSLYADPSGRLRGAMKTYICLPDSPTTIDVDLTASELLWWLRRGLGRRDAASTQRYEHAQGIHEFLVVQVMCRKGGGDKATIPCPPIQVGIPTSGCLPSASRVQIPRQRTMRWREIRQPRASISGGTERYCSLLRPLSIEQDSGVK